VGELDVREDEELPIPLDMIFRLPKTQKPKSSVTHVGVFGVRHGFQPFRFASSSSSVISEGDCRAALDSGGSRLLDRRRSWSDGYFRPSCIGPLPQYYANTTLHPTAISRNVEFGLLFRRG
jgi:hypothetical protein